MHEKNTYASGYYYENSVLTALLVTLLRQGVLPDGTAVFGRRHSLELFKLPHEMKLVFITAEPGQTADAKIAGGKMKFCQVQAGADNILLAGAMKKILIQMLKIGSAQKEGGCHFFNGPRIARIVVQLCAQGLKRFIMLAGVDVGLQ